MSLRITFDVFSGRPNPSVTLTAAESADLLAQIGAVKPSAAKMTAAPSEPVSLGYRGLIVEQLDAPASGLPQRFRLSSASVDGVAGTLKAVDASVEQSILANAALLARAGVPVDLGGRGGQPGFELGQHALGAFQQAGGIDVLRVGHGDLYER